MHPTTTFYLILSKAHILEYLPLGEEQTMKEP